LILKQIIPFLISTTNVLPKSRIFKFLKTDLILSQILINSEIITKCHKLFEARHNTQNAKNAVGTMVISTNFEKNNFHR
jgi:hypothetical protein